MSITDELREYANGWRDRSCYERLLAIADRIDEQHAKARDKAYDEGVNDGIDADKNAMGYIKLPVDVDKMPIHVGDTIEIEHNGRVTTVTNINYNEYGWEVYCAEGGGFDKDTSCRHVKPDSWERIIADAIAEGFERINLTDTITESNEELIARCKKLAGEAE